MKNNEYWEKRKQQRIWEYIEDAEETSKEIAKLYRKSSNYLNHEIQKIFDRFKKKHGISTTEAKRILNLMKDPTSFEEMLQKLKSSASSDEKDDLIKLIEAPAYRTRINRLQQLQSDIDVMMKEVYEQEKEMNTKNYINVAHDSYYKSIYDTQIATGLGFSFSKLDPFLVDKILKSKWSGLNYSERIWNNTQQLAKDVKEQILLGIMTGKTYKEMAEELSYKYQVGAYKARRLINTETSYVVGQIELESYKECDADTYIFVATLDLKTCDYCQPLDGKRFKLEEAKEGVNHHPMHPHCRCTTIVGIDDETLSKMKRRARDPETNKTYKVPANMTYKEWFKEQEEKYGVDRVQVLKKKVLNFDKDSEQHLRYLELLGKEYVPKTIDDFQEMKYNDIERWTELKQAYREVDWQNKSLKNHSSGDVHNIPFEGEPNSVFDKIKDGKVIQRRYYGKTGKPRLDIDLTDHGNSKEHPVVPHYHKWNEINKKISREKEHNKPLTLGQKIANKELLKELGYESI